MFRFDQIFLTHLFLLRSSARFVVTSLLSNLLTMLVAPWIDVMLSHDISHTEDQKNFSHLYCSQSCSRNECSPAGVDTQLPSALSTPSWRTHRPGWPQLVLGRGSRWCYKLPRSLPLELSVTDVIKISRWQTVWKSTLLVTMDQEAITRNCTTIKPQ